MNNTVTITDSNSVKVQRINSQKCWNERQKISQKIDAGTFGCIETIDFTSSKSKLYVAMISNDEVISGRMKVKNVQKLQSFAELPENWNDNGASMFSKELICKCREIIEILPVQPEIFPTAVNSIQMEYEKANGEYLEFNVYLDRIDVFEIDAAGREKEKSVYERKELVSLVEDFYARDK